MAQTAAGIALIAIAFAAAAFGIYSVMSAASHLSLRLTFVVIVWIAVPLLFRFQPVVRMLAASALIGMGAGVYSVEALSVALTDPDRPALQLMEETAKTDGVAYDSRTRLEVLADLHSRGVVAWPPFYPYLLLNSPLRIGDRDILPLGSLANARTVCCNESGQYLTYTTDEHGFRNPPGSWSKIPADVAIVGASSAVSECVEDPDSLVTLLRTRYPRTITVGAGGNGPLLELASIREYLPTVRPRLVLWLFGEVHTPEYFAGEAHNPLLLRYLDPSYSQGLAQKQNQIDRAIVDYFDRGIREEEARRTLANRTRDFAALKDTRMLMYYFVSARSSQPKPRTEFDTGLYERALREGVRTISQWGGTVALVYWPDSSRYPSGPGYSTRNVRTLDEARDKILAIAKRNRIPAIDLSHGFPERDAAGNTRFLYPFPAHFKPAGYRVAASKLMTAMSRLETETK